MKYYIICCLSVFSLIAGSERIFAQEISVQTTSVDLYNFLDELATEKLFSLNSCIKPYTRKDIKRYLYEADSSRANLTKRQQKELDQYLFEFTGQNSHKLLKEKVRWQILPPQATYFNKNTDFIIRPLYEFNYSFNKNGQPFYQSAGGAEILFHKGIVSAYANLTDHYYNKEILIKPGYLMSGLGGNYKINEGGRQGADFSEMRGGLSLSWNWGRIGLIKDNIQWGDNNFGGLIFSGQTPSFPMIYLHATPFKWLSLDYFHGWLVSEVIDSSSSYFSQPGLFRGIYLPKYIAANMISFRPWKQLDISIGNSIVYSDVPVQIAYLIPILFYKSVDHTLNHGIDNQNSQLFLNISSRNLKYLHLYGSLFIDEFSIKRITDPDSYNFTGYKIGGSLINWPIKNLVLDMESTIIYPMVYKHRVPSLTFASNKYNLGYFMGDNSIDFHVRLRYMPLSYLFAEAHYEYAVHGDDYNYVLNNDVDRHSLIKNKTWERQVFSTRITYCPVIGLKVFVEGLYSSVIGFDVDGKTSQNYLQMYSPQVYFGQNLVFNLGLKLGL
jgi:hypothetical protein